MNEVEIKERLEMALEAEMQASTAAMKVNKTLVDDNGILRVRIPDVILKLLVPWCNAVDSRREYGHELKNDNGPRRPGNNIDGKIGEIAVYMALQHTSLASYWPAEIDFDFYENNTFGFDADLKPFVHIKTCLDNDRFGPSWLADRNDPLVSPTDKHPLDPREIIVLARVVHRFRPEILGWVRAEDLMLQGRWVPSFYVGHKAAIYLDAVEEPDRGISTQGIRDLLQRVTVK
jgi:hypothetical protein